MEEFQNNIFEQEFELINQLRECLGPNVETSFKFISQKLGPDTLLAFALPAIGSYDIFLLSKVLVTLCLLNLIVGMAKIMLPEDRPYWWANKKGKEVKQSDITCESTAGFPSGHTAIISAFCYILASYNYPDTSETNIFLWISPFILLMICVRMYFYCHFLHQCLAGVIIGLSFAKWLHQEDMEEYLLNISQKDAFKFFLAITSSSIASFIAMKKYGTDPNWSVDEATEACEDSAWVSSKSSPLFSLVKELGSLAGIVLSTPLYEKVDGELEKSKSIPMAVFFGALNIFMNSKTPDESQNVARFCFGFTKGMVYTYSLINLIPRFSLEEKTCLCPN